MIRVKILTIGKTKESWLQEACHEYIKRMTPYLQLEWILVKTDQELVARAKKERELIGLDETGKLLSSVDFSKHILKAIERGGSELTFVIGGADGLPPELKQTLPLLSLSPMTFTHQMCRLILLEQLFRAFEIDKNSGYHR